LRDCRAALLSGDEEFDDVFDGFVGAVIGGFEAAGGTVFGIGAMMEAAVGERSAQPFMEEQEEQRDLDALCGEAVGVARAVALDQSVAPELAQVVAQLVQAIGALGEMEGCERSLVDLLGRPAADVSTAMQEDFEQTDDAHVVDFDAGIAHGADGDRQGDALQQREVGVNVEPLRLEAGEAAGDGLEGVRTASRWSKPFLRPKSARLLEHSSLRRNVENFSYCLRKAFLK